ncbi:SigE family RNA polymerase sigma factor [Phytohabitans sp. LJ34]|uniref:SigE family RNA polymerase sigma factor n=1 Tax=Phytohabitans sp. LJ34 TaxID=3452217 RepID=UPI003F8C7169
MGEVVDRCDVWTPDDFWQVAAAVDPCQRVAGMIDDAVVSQGNHEAITPSRPRLRSIRGVDAMLISGWVQPCWVVVRLCDVTVLSGSAVRDDFDAVYSEHFAPMVRLAYVTTGSLPAAEDIVQEVFVALLARADVREPGAWLRRAVISRCTSWVRRLRLERRHSVHGRPEPVTPLGPDGVAVRAALGRLRPRHRAAVFLRYYLDLTEAEIAHALGCRPGTVKSLLHRAHAALREYLDEH